MYLSFWNAVKETCIIIQKWLNSAVFMNIQLWRRKTVTAEYKYKYAFIDFKTKLSRVGYGWAL